MSIHIIAEAGTNNNGSLQKAKKLAQIAKNANADSVKFQLINTWELYLPGVYKYGKYDIKEVIRIREKGQMEDIEYLELARLCKNIGIPFSASIFDPKGLDLLAKLNPPYIKIASGDLNHISLLRKVAEKGIKMILSTGMASMTEIERSIKEITRNDFKDIVLLHCVSVYPAVLRQMNLNFLDELKSNFGFPIGLSDHTGDSIAACMALTKGATWFEKHFTEDKNQEGLDHAYAQNEEELSQYIRNLHDAETALAGTEIKVSDEERETAKRARRSLYASRDINKGEIIKNKDILIVRPESYLAADKIDTIIGKTLNTDLKQYQPFKPDYIN